MSWLGRILGVSEDVSEMKETNKSLIKTIKQQSKTIETLREEADNTEHTQSRWDREQIRNVREFAEDIEHSSDRAVIVADRNAKEAIEDAKRAAESNGKKILDQKNIVISELQSQVRDLELAAGEAQQDIDIAIQEGVLEYKEQHLEDTMKLQVKIATVEGDARAAKAESTSKDVIIKVLTSLLEKSGETNDSLVDAIMEVAPKINLEKLGFEVTVPVAAKQGGEQKKDK